MPATDLYRELGFSCAELGGYLEISKQGAGNAVWLGENYVKQNQLNLTT